MRGSMRESALPARRRWSNEDARQVLDAWERSGESLADSAASAGLERQRLERWCKRLGVSKTPADTLAKRIMLVPLEVSVKRQRRRPCDGGVRRGARRRRRVEGGHRLVGRSRDDARCGMVILLPRSVRILVATAPVNLRKSFEGSSNEVRAVLAGDPLSGHVFLFLNRTRTQVERRPGDPKRFAHQRDRRFALGRLAAHRRDLAGRVGRALDPHRALQERHLHRQLRHRRGEELVLLLEFGLAGTLRRALLERGLDSLECLFAPCPDRRRVHALPHRELVVGRLARQEPQDGLSPILCAPPARPASKNVGGLEETCRRASLHRRGSCFDPNLFPPILPPGGIRSQECQPGQREHRTMARVNITTSSSLPRSTTPSFFARPRISS